ncbi:MAG: excinuclease ABC subunit UvrA, partial [candidate division KSB1 bacterium]|nr:excinuclease ABC subunit UvrA [candidate division KSB1 bacterium]
MADKESIVIRGAREHNLKNIDLEIPRNKLVVITGLSGSGKSSLAFDTIYAEGQRRYVESLSAYARQFLSLMEKPDVDYIEGLSPAISIEQRTAAKNPRSTVATVTEIYDYLRLLFARIGVPYCYNCGRRIERQTVEQIVQAVLALPEGRKIQVLAPIVRGRKGEYREVFEEARRDGYVRVRVDGEVYDLDAKIKLDKNKKHNIEVVVDRLVLGPQVASRLADSVETALGLGSGMVLVEVIGEQELLFSEHYACVECGISYEELAPRQFSFNSPYGACPTCNGLGERMVVDPALVIPDDSLSLNQGAIAPWGQLKDGWYRTLLQGAASHLGLDLDTPVRELKPEQVQAILYGLGERQIRFKYRSATGRHESTFTGTFEGVIPHLERRYRETESEAVREWIEGFMRPVRCPECGGARLKKE